MAPFSCGGHAALVWAIVFVVIAAGCVTCVTNSAASSNGHEWILGDDRVLIGLELTNDSHLVVSRFAVNASGKFTINLALNSSCEAEGRGGSLLQLASWDGRSTAAWANGSTIVHVDAAARCISAKNMYHRDAQNRTVSREDWNMCLVADAAGTAMRWRVNRTFTAPVAVVSDRLALSLVTTGAAPFHGNQIPSFLDPDMFMNTSRSGGFDLHGPHSPVEFFEFCSARTDQFIVLSPVYAQLKASFSLTRSCPSGSAKLCTREVPASFSFAKPFADGTARIISLGMQACDRRAAPVKFGAGDQEEAVWTLQVLSTQERSPDSPYPQLQLQLPRHLHWLQRNASLFADVHDQWMGWVFGNNPASVPCLQEMSWFVWIAGLFGADNLGAGGTVAAVRREIEFFAQCGWGDGMGHNAGCVDKEEQNLGRIPGPGLLMHRWGARGFYNAPWGPMMDQQPHFILAVHALALLTGDKAWLKTMLGAVEAVASFLQTHSVDGVFLVPNASGLPDSGRHCSNWYDIIEFGHADGYVNALVNLAYTALEDIYAFLGDEDKTARWRRAFEEGTRAFNALFWNASAGVYHDWVDIRGHKRSYFYVSVDFFSVMSGVANTSQTAAIMKARDTRYTQLAKEFKVNVSDIWSVPCNLYPITDKGDAAIPSAVPAPAYENMGSFFHDGGFESVARGMNREPAQVVAGFANFIRNGFVPNRGWAQQLLFNTGQLLGGDPLNNALLALWGFLRGGFGFRPTLSRGVQFEHPPAPELEGARYVFAHMDIEGALIQWQELAVSHE